MNKDKDEEKKIREELNEQLDRFIDNLRLALLAKLMLNDIDTEEIEVAYIYINKLSSILLKNNKKDD